MVFTYGFHHPVLGTLFFLEVFELLVKVGSEVDRLALGWRVGYVIRLRCVEEVRRVRDPLCLVVGVAV